MSSFSSYDTLLNFGTLDSSEYIHIHELIIVLTGTHPFIKDTYTSLANKRIVNEVHRSANNHMVWD